jgi:HAE1 family hydrophobic/amphiphilic exporter-1
MAAFFINRPIVAMVISILLTIIGLVSMVGLPVAQFPNIVPPEVSISASYVGADAITVEQSVATPIEQQMSGVDNMNYMYSVNANSGVMNLRVNFGLGTDPDIAQILAQMRVNQADSQLPSDVRNAGVTVTKGTSSPLLLFCLYSPNGTYDSTFLANYAFINLNDAMTRVKGIASVTIFGAGQYAMRIWVQPDQLAKLNVTIPEIINAIRSQNTVNPAGTVGGEPVPEGQAFTYSVATQGRLSTEEEFGAIVLRAATDGSMVRVRDVARVELGSQNYSMLARLDGKPTAVMALYQMPDTNAIDAAAGARKMMEELSQRFQNDLEYLVALDTTLAVSEGMKEITHTLFEAMILVIIVVFIFLQGWRATLIPLLAVPVSLIGTFAFFPMFGFSINTLSLFGLVLAIGLVVDDAIVVVEAVEHHIEKGLSPKEATLKAMSEVSGPVIAIALILSAVFVPTVFIPGITGQLYQQFAITIAISVIISAFNALTLSPALAAILLKPKSKNQGLLGPFYHWFNRSFGRVTNGYVGICHFLIRKLVISGAILLLTVLGAGYFGSQLPSAFIPAEDQGFAYVGIELPAAASLQRTDQASKIVEAAIEKIPGVQHVTSIVGYNLLSGVSTTYNSFFFVTLKPWHERKTPELSYKSIFNQINRELRTIPEFNGFAFPPPAIPGVGTSGGVTFILQDRSGRDVEYLAEQTKTFINAAQKRPELASVLSTWSSAVPRVFVEVNRDKVLKQELDVKDVYQTLQCFMGGVFVNYFNRFGRQWQVYVQADGPYRTRAEDMSHFYVRNRSGGSVPLDSVTDIGKSFGPEFTMRFNLYRSVQLNVAGAPGVSSAQVMNALEEVFKETMPGEMGYDYMGMSYQERQAQLGVPASAIFTLSLLFVFLILAAQYESWSLPFSVLLGTPVALLGAFSALWGLRFVSTIYENNIYTQIGLVMLIGLAAKNSILIVEFCKMKVEEGVDLVEATLQGARLRFRPILMTAFAFILGCVPLAIASGSGAVSRRVMGTTVIGGMLAATFIGILLVPMLFYVVERLTRRHPAPLGPGPKGGEPLPVEPPVAAVTVKAPEQNPTPEVKPEPPPDTKVAPVIVKSEPKVETPPATALPAVPVDPGVRPNAASQAPVTPPVPDLKKADAIPAKRDLAPLMTSPIRPVSGVEKTGSGTIRIGPAAPESPYNTQRPEPVRPQATKPMGFDAPFKATMPLPRPPVPLVDPSKSGSVPPPTPPPLPPKKSEEKP